MIYSMTAFARRTSQQSWGAITCEIYTLNHRYLELSFKLPDELRQLEAQLRERVGKQLHRGKVEIQFKYQAVATEHQRLHINQPALQELLQLAQQVGVSSPQPLTISFTDLLAWPGVLAGSRSIEDELLQQTATTLFDETLQELLNTRAREGEALRRYLESHVEQVMAQLAHIQMRLPQISVIQRRKMLARVSNLHMTVESPRLEQELLMLAQKMDVAEEIERITIHLTETSKTLTSSGAIGRRLDFLMQELNREANTLGSKSTDSDVTLAVVNLKVLIEQMREQVQNIE